MLSRTLVSVTAALGLFTSTLARAEDVVSLAAAVNALASKDPAAAARLAAAGAARSDLDNATRVLLGGLAYGNFKRAFEAKETGGDVADLCGLAAVMRLVAPLDDDPEAAQVKLNAAAQADATLERLKGPGWRSVCEPARTPEEAHDEPVTERPAAKPADETTVRQTEGPTLPPAVNDGRAVRADGVTRSRRLRAGAGLLTSGFLLVAPLAAVLAYRARGERDLWAVHAASVGGMATDMQTEQAASLRHRYQVTTASAAALGVTAAALAVTGVVLLATGGGRSKVAVAPWGARGVGGLVLEGRF